MKLKGKNAISLIVLVITILVLSILAATVIISLSNTNIISQANDAVKKTEAQQIEEAKTLMYADGMLGNTPEAIVIGDTTLTWDAESKTIIEKATSNGVTTVDKVTIPDGFYYVGGTKDTGLVISDNSADENKGVSYTCEGNQFVWVPVEYTATGKTDENGLDTGFTAVFKSGTAEETYEGSGIYKMTGEKKYVDFLEYVENDAMHESVDFYAMCASVQNYGGFYIGRFEAGDGDVSEPRTAFTDSHKVVSQKGAYVYNYVSNYVSSSGQNNPDALSKSMYKNSTSVVSTLCYGPQWDATLNFVSDAEHNIIDSYSWGNIHSHEEYEECGYCSFLEPRCGASETWQAKNIYDLAGNVAELTMSVEWDYKPDGICYYRNVRGGEARNLAGYGAAGNIGYGFPSELDEVIGFRVALYLK